MQLRDGTERSYCSWVRIQLPSNEAVTECTQYENRYTYAPIEMQRLGWVLELDKGTRVVGFRPPKKEE